MALPHLEGPLHGSTCVHLWPNLRTTMYYLDNQMIPLKLCRTNSSLKCSTIPLAVSSYVAKQYPLSEDLDDEVIEHKDLEMHCEQSLSSDSHHKEGSSEIGNLDYHHFEAVVTCSMKELRETLRRRRIGMANKGKVPWNKERKHTEETCARIKERTVEAKRDPKVRRRMSEATRTRTHSEQSKKKIGSSLKKLWAKRLKLKRSKEKFYYSWAESIAEAAKKGGIDEEQLCWDSYEIQKDEIAGRRRQQNEKKAKEMVIQAVKRARERAQKKALLAENKVDLRQHEGEPRAKKKVRRSRKTSKLSLESSLTKIKEKKSVEESFRRYSGVMSDLHSALEKFDIESIKEEQKRNTMSLADQIQAAKSRRQR